jgi:DNA topoisomerase-3
LDNGEFERPRNGKNNDNAHPPIHPVKDGSNLQGDERRLFDYIARRYLGCCSRNAQCEETTIEIDVAEERFTATGLIIRERNFMDVFRWGGGGNERVMPNFVQGERFTPTLRMSGGTTSAPQHLTEAQLITLMDKSGIGTDATIPEHIKKMLDRNYASKEAGQKFIPTNLGYALMEGYEAMGFGYDISLGKPYLRASFEKDLKRLCAGQVDKVMLVNQYVEMYRNVYTQVALQSRELIQAIARHMGFDPTENPPLQIEAPKHVKPCSQCRGSMVLKSTTTGKSMISCTAYPTCKNCIWIPETLIKSISVLETQCRRHGGGEWHMVQLTFLPNKAPAYMYPTWECCFDCDEDVKEIMDQHRRTAPRPALQLAQRNQPAQRSQPQRNQPALRNQASICSCGIAAVQVTVQKEGPNKGKLFWTCPKGRDNGCAFFEWDDNPNGQATRAPSTRGRGRASTRGRGRGVTRGRSKRGRSGKARGKRGGSTRPAADPIGIDEENWDDEME